ncbi:Thermolysin metallopeptidase, catalytic domain [Streptomyces sp. SolWspMP-sol7th]|nr:Thermolysin metallopeptidase, catalytic domain [Streptomyces sp. SolWspMP-sol7th]
MNTHPHLPHQTFCTIVPPHLLDHLARAGHAAARRTLDEDAGRRHQRRQTALALTLATPAGAPTDSETPDRTIYDARHGIRLPGHKVRAEGQEPTRDASVNRAYAGLGATFDLYRKVFGRDSIDGRGLPLVASVHYDREYNNAFWDGDQMVFGDGDGEIFLDFTLPVDVIGHELTHGVTQHTANLEYQDQAGALNESISDVFGSLVKQYAKQQRAEDADWLIGDELLAPDVQGTALRSMKAPGTAYDDDVLGKDPQPASMDDYVDTEEDNGGVHINSGTPQPRLLPPRDLPRRIRVGAGRAHLVRRAHGRRAVLDGRLCGVRGAHEHGGGRRRREGSGHEGVVGSGGFPLMSGGSTRPGRCSARRTG